MKLPFGLTTKTLAGIALALAGIAAATGAAFAAWVNNADGIFMSVIESGLAWCM
jgi:hypothetical protein